MDVTENSEIEDEIKNVDNKREDDRSDSDSDSNKGKDNTDVKMELEVKKG
jgi:hypothetical protein